MTEHEEAEKAMTASKLIERLSTLPPDTIITTSESDSEWGFTYTYGVSDVSETGEMLPGALLKSDAWDGANQ